MELNNIQKICIYHKVKDEGIEGEKLDIYKTN